MSQQHNPTVSMDVVKCSYDLLAFNEVLVPMAAVTESAAHAEEAADREAGFVWPESSGGNYHVISAFPTEL